MSCEGSTFYETPHIDALAERSLRFERGYSSCQVCSPSRAAIQSGKDACPPAHHRLHFHSRQQPARAVEPEHQAPCLSPYKSELPLEEVTIAEALKEHGYATFFAGKWHLGAGRLHPFRAGLRRQTSAAITTARRRGDSTLRTTTRK